MSNLEAETVVQVPPVRKNRSVWIIAVIVIALLICLCLVASAALLYFDPFDWGLLGRVLGGYDAIARTVPADTDVHVSVDMLKLLAEDSRAVFDTFARSAGDPDVTSREDFIRRMDETLMETYGVTFSDDIQPWIGQYAGLSLLNLDLEGGSDTQNWVLAIEARDRKAADAFVDKMITYLSQESGEEAIVTTYEGTNLYSSAYYGDPIAVGRHKNIIFFSDDIANIQQTIDVSKGQSLADDKNYQTVIAKLPSTRLLTAYLSPEVFQQLTSLAGQTVFGGQSSPGNSQNSAISLSLVQAGLQFDIITAYDLDSLSQAQIDSLSFPGAEGTLAGEMPQDVLLFLTGRDLNHAWGNLLDYLQQSAGMDTSEITESMQLLEGEIGFNPERDLFPYLDQEWAISVVRERDSILSAQLDIPIGLLCMAETGSPDQLSQNVSATADHLGKLGLVVVDEKTLGDMTLYEAKVFLVGNPLFSFGMRGNQFLLSTNPERLESLAESSTGLAETDQWKNTWGAVPDNMNPILYLDWQSLMDIIPDTDLTEFPFLKPVHTLALAGSPLDRSTRHWVLLMTIE